MMVGRTLAALGVIALLGGCNAVDSFNAVGDEIKADAAADAAAAAQSPAQRAYAEANARMHAGMGGAIPADADEAFIRGMIPHHQGAIDMARVVLEHGDDAATKDLARRVIAAQEREIAEMRAWLAAHGGEAAPAAAASNSAAPMDHAAMGH